MVKQVKISNEQLEKDICEGGLKPMNVKKLNEAVKNSWIKLLLYGSERCIILFIITWHITIKSCFGNFT